MKRVYFYHLDIIRFFAAFFIFLGHGFQAWEGFFKKGTEPVSPVLKNLSVNMGLGVEVFFFISGFLITYILLKEKRETGRVAIGKFFLRRALRIWPLYFLLIAVTPFIVMWLDEPTPNYAAQLSFIGNFHIIAIHGWEYPFSHFWSIAVEEQFYLVWPFIIAFIPRKRLVFVFIGLILFSAFSRYYCYANWPNAFHIYYNTLCRMDTLVLGAIFAFVYERWDISFRLKKWMVVVCYMVLLVSISFTNSISWWSFEAVIFKKYFYLLPIVPLALHYISAIDRESPSKGYRILSYFGKASYGLYMIHNMLIIIVVKKIMLNNGLSEGWMFWAIYTIMTFVLVIVSFELYEKPFLKLKEYFTVVKTRSFFK